jgi:23S rRNA (uridine2552-2'-O)-methyltransferase
VRKQEILISAKYSFSSIFWQNSVMKQGKTKGNRWEDHYSRRAQKERFPARSVYKLKEIQLKYGLIQKGDKVLDLGCAPGSWLLYAAELTGCNGAVVGIDMKPVTVPLPPHVKVYSGDLLALNENPLDAFKTRFNVILSDMAPATTGNRTTDSARSYELCRAALTIAQNRLVSGGAFVCKIFQGEAFQIFVDAVKKNFLKFKLFKPQSSRKASREIYIIARGKR